MATNAVLTGVALVQSLSAKKAEAKPAPGKTPAVEAIMYEDGDECVIRFSRHVDITSLSGTKTGNPFFKIQVARMETPVEFTADYVNERGEDCTARFTVNALNNANIFARYAE